jgi:hypothetical protein
MGDEQRLKSALDFLTNIEFSPKSEEPPRLLSPNVPNAAALSFLNSLEVGNKPPTISDALKQLDNDSSSSISLISSLTSATRDGNAIWFV